ncbi:hypothetical protein GJ496_008504 [Pomphorhynchus laevis]|nr:hypothetical protein GJ496_008504 [Pomphorhynchus laevis]
MCVNDVVVNTHVVRSAQYRIESAGYTKKVISQFAVAVNKINDRIDDLNTINVVGICNMVLTILVTLNGVHCNIKIDTGASVTLATQVIVDWERYYTKNKRTTISVTSQGIECGNLINILGKDAVILNRVEYMITKSKTL